MDQFDHALRILEADNLDVSSSIGLGVFARNTKLFRAGDFVIVWFVNGGGMRWPVYGRSSRGFDVEDYYVQGHRYRERGCWYPGGVESWQKPRRSSRLDQYSNKATLRLVAVPREVLSACSTSGAATLRGWFSEALRSGYAASGVGSSSSALPPLPYIEDDGSPRARRKRWFISRAHRVMW
jgi:hypothetical protein